MSFSPGHYAILAIAIALAGCNTSSSNLPGTPTVSSPTANVSDLVGARGSSGEMQLQDRGYVIAQQRGLTTYWWNGAAGSCVEVVTGDGRYQSVEPVSSNQCGY